MDRSLRHSLNGVRIEWLDAEFNPLDASRFVQSPSSNAMPPIFSGQRLLAYSLVEPKYDRQTAYIRIGGSVAAILS